MDSPPPIVRLLAWRSTLVHILREARKRKPHGTPTPTVGDITNRYFTPEDKKETGKLEKSYAKLRSQFQKALSSHVGGMESGVLNTADFAATTRSYIRKYYKAAYALGKKITADNPDLTDDDVKAIDGEADDEIPYAEKFGDDLESGAGRMDYEERAGMYTKALDSLFNMGQVSGMPPETVIFWRLGAAEHCPDCIELAANSPYTPSSLPTVPRAGETVCLTHCKCSLDIDYPDNPPAPKPDKPKRKPQPDRDPGGQSFIVDPDSEDPGRPDDDDGPDVDPIEPDEPDDEPDLPSYPHPEDARAASVPDRDQYGDPVTDDVADQIEDLRAKMNYYRQRAELATDGDEQDQFLKLRRQANSDLIDLEDKHKVYSVPTWSVKELVQAAKSAPPESHVTEPTTIRKGQSIALMKGRSVWRAKIQKIEDEEVTVKTFDGQTVTFRVGEPPYLIFDAPDIDWDGDGEAEDFETLDPDM